MSAVETAAPTEQELRDIVNLTALKRDLERQVRAHESQLNPIKDRVRKWMAEQGKRMCRRMNFSITIQDGRANVRWKDLYTAVAGAEAAVTAQEEAEKLQILEVQPIE